MALRYVGEDENEVHDFHAPMSYENQRPIESVRISVNNFDGAHPPIRGAFLVLATRRNHQDTTVVLSLDLAMRYAARI